MTRHPLLIEDLPALRRKLTGARGSLAAKWAHFQTLAKHQSATLPLYPAFVGLVTDDDESVRRFRALLEHKIDGWPALNRTVHMQYHVWCSIMAFARWAVALDWVADHPAMTGFDLEKAADTFLDATYGHAYPVLTARVPASDNQIASMLLAAALVGHLFGVKRATDPRARLLLDYALDRVHEVTDHAAPWFVGEGSGYLEAVNIPVIGWWLTTLRWLGVPTDPEKWLGCLRLGRGLISPAGLSLGWDHYGLQRAFALSGLALLARETHDPAPLAVMDRLNLWRGIDHGAWGEDARLWTLVYWPDDAPDFPARALTQADTFPGWMHPRIGGALDEPARGLRFFQAWDLCSGRAASVGRAQADANAISLEVNGSPLVLDGVPLPHCQRFEFRPEVMFSPAEVEELERGCVLMSQVQSRPITVAALVKDLAYGTLAGSNSLIINREPWWFPRQPMEGRGTLWCALPGLKAVAAECASHYAPRYPIHRAERLSVCVDALYVLTLDQIEARTPVEITWQAYTRAEARRLDDRVAVTTPEGPRLQIVPDDPRQLTVESVEGFPRVPAVNATCVQWTRRLDHGVLATLLWPEDDHRLGPLDDTWEGGFRADLQATPSAPVARGPLDDVTDVLAAAEASRWRWLRCRSVAPRQSDYLRILIPNSDATVFLNGQRVPPPSDPALLPWRLALTAGEPFELLVLTRSDRGRLQTDPGTFYQASVSLTPTVRSTDDHRWVIRAGPVVHEWQRVPGGQTDAGWVLRTQDRRLFLLNATHFRADGIPPLNSQRPVHALWDRQQWITQSTELPNQDAPTNPGGPAATRPLGQPPVPCAPARSPGRAVAAALVADDQEQLRTDLKHDDWRVRMAAAQRLGDLGDPRAAPMLREALRAELACGDLYPPVPDAPASQSWLEAMIATGREVGVNRYRVAQSCLIALGQLRDREAVALAREILHDVRHFYPLHHRACLLLGDLGGAGDLPLLERWSHHYEVNTQTVACQALARLRTQLHPS